MAAPPGKKLIKLADGRTIAVPEADAQRYEYFSQGGKVMRRPRAPPAPAAAPARPPTPPPAAPPPRQAPGRPAAPPASQPRSAPTRPAAPPAAPPSAPPAARTPPPPRAAAPPPTARAPLRPAPPGARGPPPGARGPPMRRGPPGRGRRPPPTFLAKPAMLGYNARVILVAIVLAALIFSPVTYPIFESYGPFIDQLINFNPNTFNQRTFPKIAEFDLTRLVTISVTGASINYNLTLSSPTTLPGLQEVNPVTTTPNPTGEALWWFWNRPLSAGGTELVNVTYHLKMTTHEWVLTDEEVGTAADVPSTIRIVDQDIPSADLLDIEWKINPLSPAVRAKADEITSASKPYLQQLDDMYTWLLSNYEYQRSPSYEPKAPEQTMQDFGGDCDDFSVLFISMARYLGIPAWLELGLLYDEFRNEWGPHGWASVYVPLANGTGVTVTIDVVNRLFLIRDPYHFSDWVADGNAQHLEDYYTLLSYQQAGGGTPSVSVEQDVFNGPMETTGTLNYFHG